MEIRTATDDDVDAIRSIAHQSLSSTYTDFLGEETVESAIDQWYGDGFGDELEDDHAVVLVVERDGEIAGFSQSDLVGQQYGSGRILWLHVRPDHRGSGTGVRLLVRTRETLIDEGADHVEGFVLADNAGGNEFYREHGFEQAGQREVEIGDETFTENVYVEGDLEDEGWGAIDELEIDGETVYVSYGEAARGSRSPFYSAYRDDDRKELYAWLCGNCDSIDNTMDTMGRIECNVCGNRRKATRWDASYL
ncbi:GNAT family N-acetyltransferase [Halopiger xanaduensis]|uniref:GCN5-related N-acetyltransferase n=1 Tax=Halopiger xanaduensis (strain DSM 18323 / JCM 14033 / SH-6) TaxID=797210 RepID=F8DC78_HALXS|nr:GNAT family N-acetyltransferase [Halopiger xanaduensis]AEH37197.1 GCN5-related N-acetyltransferase [Halopiger xanaduensis SH-6]